MCGGREVKCCIAICCGLFYGQGFEVLVCFVDIGDIVGHQLFRLSFHNISGHAYCSCAIAQLKINRKQSNNNFE